MTTIRYIVPNQPAVQLLWDMADEIGARMQMAKSHAKYNALLHVQQLYIEQAQSLKRAWLMDDASRLPRTKVGA